MVDEWKEVLVEWVGNQPFGSQPAVDVYKLDLPRPIRPWSYGTITLGVAGCTGMDIVSILSKKRQKIEKFEVHIKGKELKYILECLQRSKSSINFGVTRLNLKWLNKQSVCRRKNIAQPVQCYRQLLELNQII